jgi:acyl-CoA hydrolase
MRRTAADMAWQDLCTSTRRSAADALALVRDGESIVVPTGVGEPPALLTALSDQRSAWEFQTVCAKPDGLRVGTTGGRPGARLL